MQKKSDFILTLCLLAGDSLALVLSIAGAYFIRTHVDPRPYVFESQLYDFTIAVIWLIPILLIILAALGLYKKSIFLGKSRILEIWRIFIAAILSISALIVYSFFIGTDLFPVRVMAILATILAFILLVLERSIIRLIAHQIFKKNYGTKRAIVIGNHKNTEFLSSYIASTPESSYHLVGIVSSNRYIPKNLLSKQCSSLKDALKKSSADIIFQTDERSTEYVFRQAVNHHLLYYFIPSETTLSSHFGELELVGNTPAVLVKLTPLTGGNAFVKRNFDFIFSLFAIIIAAIPMAIIWLILKITDWHSSPIYADERLTQYNRKFRCYKFRSMRSEYSGMTAEEAFKKMGKPELIKKYRQNGDYIKNDPRVTRFGHFLRRTSIDELPQLFNILKGDISLIGPRALLPGELRNYGDRSLILTVKSGLTGLAQVSGRRDIPFEERRALDIYYVMNWSILLDTQIFFKTIISVLKHEGAK